MNTTSPDMFTYIVSSTLLSFVMSVIGCDADNAEEIYNDEGLTSLSGEAGIGQNEAGTERNEAGTTTVDFGDEIGGVEAADMNGAERAGTSDLSLDIGVIDAGEPTGGEIAGEEALYQPNSGPSADEGEVVSVSATAELIEAINDASPGDVITLEPGVYTISQLVTIRQDGAEDNRIFLRAAELGQVTLELSHIENFKIYAKFWIFENLRFVGVCTNGQGCEHAFHIVGDADDLIFRNNEIIDFASHVKLNGERLGPRAAQSFPDRVMFLDNLWHNTRYIRNNAPHNILNLDGGRDHIVRGNIFADYSTPPDLPKSASAIYPKASTSRILIEQNLIVCEKQRLEGETNRGIELGDGAPASICDGDDDQDGDGDCMERGQSQEAIVRNNIIIGCNNGGSSAGLMVSSDRESLLLHNTVVGVGQRNAGFYKGHPDHETYWRANILERGINVQYAERMLNEVDNLAPTQEELNLLFAAPTEGDLSLLTPDSLTNQVVTDPDAPHDFCGYPRGPRADLGAIEYSTVLSGSPCVDRVRMMYRRIP